MIKFWDLFLEKLMDTMPDSDTTKVWTDILCCPQCYEPLELIVNEPPNKQSLRCSNCNDEFPGVADSFDLKITEGKR